VLFDMAKNEQEEAYEKALSAALGRTIDMLKFAETKNAALLTFNSAWVLGSLNLLMTKSPLPLGYGGALTMALPLFGASALVSLFSFVPKLQLRGFFKRPTPNPVPNLLFFKDMAVISADRADQTFRSAYEPVSGRSATDRYLADLAVQLAVNGGIADKKFALFNRAVWLDVLAMICLALPALWSLAAGVLGLDAA
jgi:hypothetical protein